MHPTQVLEVAQGLSRAADFEEAILTELIGQVGADVGFVGLNGEPPIAMGLDAVRLHRLQLAHGARYEAELLPVKRAALAARGAVVDTAVLGERRVRGLHYFRDFAAPLGGRHSLYALLQLRGEVLGGLVLGRTGSTFGDAEVAQVADVLGALSVARASYRLVAPLLPPSPPLEGAPFWKLGVLGRARTRDGQEIVVRDRGAYREMVARCGDAEMIWTRVERSAPTRSGWPYVDLFHLAAANAERRERALFLGCGGGVAPWQFARAYPGICMDIVEPEPAVVALARAHFRLDALPRTQVHDADAAAFVAAAPAGTWDVVVVDAYDAFDVPGDLLGKAFLGHLGRVLRPGGAMAFNVIGSLVRSGSVQALARSAEEVFEDVRLVPVTELGEELSPARRNVVIVCSKLRQSPGARGRSGLERT